MKIHVLTYGYNEIKLLPVKKAWCDYHGLKMVYFDNESTDGSKQWAIDNGVFESDIITDGAFDIVTIINHLEDYRKQNHHTYDWSILAGVDTFLSGAGVPINKYLNQYIKTIKTKNESEVEGVRAFGVNICRIKDQHPIKLNGFTRCTQPRDVLFIAKSTAQIQIDNISCTSGIEIKPICLWWFNFGNIKPASERKETYNRRKLAWDRGMLQGYGSHYRTLKSFNYTLPLSMTVSIDEQGARPAYEELCSLLDTFEFK